MVPVGGGAVDDKVGEAMREMLVRAHLCLRAGLGPITQNYINYNYIIFFISITITITVIIFQINYNYNYTVSISITITLCGKYIQHLLTMYFCAFC